ncbi:MAG: transposase [Clostridia bacterium]|nr:transposase [Clostridia bacterium]
MVFDKEAKGPGGAQHFDYVTMFKILIVQRFYSLSDEQTEYKIKDRLSFQKFLGLTLSDEVPMRRRYGIFGSVW